LGLSINFQWGPVNAQWSQGLAIDDTGNVGWYDTGGGGTGAGGKYSGGVCVFYSNAKTINDLQGPFTYGSGGAGEGYSLELDTFTGPSPNGPVFGIGGTAGIGIGAGAASGISGTTITPLGKLW